MPQISLPTIEHAGVLEDVTVTPAYLLTDGQNKQTLNSCYSCSFCGVGDSGKMVSETRTASTQNSEGISPGSGVLTVELFGQKHQLEANVLADGCIEVNTPIALTSTGGITKGELQMGEQKLTVNLKALDRELSETGILRSQKFRPFNTTANITVHSIKETLPTSGCIKLKLSLMRQRVAFPIHIAPSILERDQTDRRTVTYEEAIAKFADLLLAHRDRNSKVLVYACGQIDYFAVFAMQEVFRLLGIRNITGNAEHCLNSGAIHNEILTGQEGPFLSIAQAIEGPNRVYLFNGWNGFITHPPVFNAIGKREDLDAYLIEVMVTESAKALSQKLGDERILLIKPRTDPHLALAVAHEILTHHPHAVEQRFINFFSDEESYQSFITLASGMRFEAQTVAERIAPAPEFILRLVKGIKAIAKKFSEPGKIPINIPSMGLSQTSGVVAHCLWGSVLAMLGKYGLNADGSPAGGTLRIPGQINAESEVQGMSRKYFMGRILMKDSAEAATRMGLPEDAYESVLADSPRAALDYSDPTPGQRELIISFGTQFEANMMGRKRWLRKLEDEDNSLIVVDPIPDPFTLENADLILPSPPHPATTKLYQNGEWKLSVSVPNKQAAKQTRSDTTIIYDVMEEISRRLDSDETLMKKHPDLARFSHSGYLRSRFVRPSPETQLTSNHTVLLNRLSTNITLAVGRAMDCDVMICHSAVSRKHAVLTCIDSDKPLFKIQDTQSGNGVFLNGVEISEATFSLDDKIMLGPIELTPSQYLPVFKANRLKENVNVTAIDQQGLQRIDGEVSRVQLWQRVLDYMNGGCGPLYCRPEHADGSPILWQELLEKGSIIYGGVGQHRYKLDYDHPEKPPFSDIYRRPRKFLFFTPTEDDLCFPDGVILNSGRSSLSDDRERIRFATSSFNSGKATPLTNMPDDNPLYISPDFARRLHVKDGDSVRLTGRYTGDDVVLPVSISDRVIGETVYTSFHKSRAQIEKQVYINDVTSHIPRCPYSSQTQVKANQILLEPLNKSATAEIPMEVAALRHRTAELLHPSNEAVDTTHLDPKADLPLWQGQSTPLYVTDIVQDTHDVFTFRFQGNPLCRFVYWPGQFCTLVLNIEGKKVLRSYTISSTPTRPYSLDITIKRVPGGLVSNWLPDNVKVGDRIDVAGPKGKFCLVPGKIPPKLLLVSGGSGVTPMISMSRWLNDVAANVDVKFLSAIRGDKDIIFQNEIELLAGRQKNFMPLFISGDKASRHKFICHTGRVNADIIQSAVPDLHQRHVYICGPGGFMDAVKAILTKLNFPKENLHIESFGGIRTSKDNKIKPMSSNMGTTKLVSILDIPTTTEDQNSLAIEFTHSGKKITTDGLMPILDLAEEQDIDIDYSCRSGSCGDCKAKLIKGKVDMECEDGLEAEDKAAGYILTCVSTPVTDCLVEL